MSHEQPLDPMVDEIFNDLERDAQIRQLGKRRDEAKSAAMVDEIFDGLEQNARAKDEHPVQETSEQREARIAEGWTTPAEDKALEQDKQKEIDDKLRESVKIHDAIAQNISPEAAEIVALGMEDFEGSQEAGTARHEAFLLMKDIQGVIQGDKGRATVDIIGKDRHGKPLSDAQGKDMDNFVTELHKLLGATGTRAKPYFKDGKVELPAGGGLVTSYSGYSGGEATPDDYSVKELTPTGLVITERYINHPVFEGESEPRRVVKEVTVEKFSPASPEHIGLNLKLDKRKDSFVELLQEAKDKLEATYDTEERARIESKIRFIESEIKVIDSLIPKDEATERIAA